ncbi:MAG: hypothetical protein ABW217_03950 [Polyangiaceae bacterium]
MTRLHQWFTDYRAQLRLQGGSNAAELHALLQVQQELDTLAKARQELATLRASTHDYASTVFVQRVSTLLETDP